ncbi:MAG: hydrolase [Acidobacteria bacterium]|nr:hydrolase [Acidobacteriota bacterium]
MSRRIYEGKHIDVLEHHGWEYVQRKKATEAVAVVAVTGDGRLILTEQYRRAVDARVVDFPAGLVGDETGETIDPAETAMKELEEETGYVCGSVELLAKGPTSPGITSELVSFYRALRVERRGEGGGIGDEAIEVHAVPRSEIRRWLQKKEEEGVLIDLKVWGGLYFVTPSP